jgi:acyl carrier protein phosphodiesterase
MNWLAHLLLSEPTDEFRIGNLLPDMVPLNGLTGLPPGFLRGVNCHRRIDAFTDAHPVVRRSIGRLESRHRRFGGIIVDLFYDHFLAQDWAAYSRLPLERFTEEVYAAFVRQRRWIPAPAVPVLEAMSEGNWLCSYREREGVRIALNRIGARLKKPQQLGEAVADLELHHDALLGDFQQFLPELLAHVRATSESARPQSDVK